MSKQWRKKDHIPWTWLPQAQMGVFQLCLWPLTAPGYLGNGCHGSHRPSDATCQYPLVLLLLLTINCYCTKCRYIQDETINISAKNWLQNCDLSSAKAIFIHINARTNIILINVYTELLKLYILQTTRCYVNLYVNSLYRDGPNVAGRD